ncbi:MAG: hypothetical protein GC152_05145 [Alphaproteobacteria bacterium]|nr:hypothetical protein [Alphaproteobacteria bacterium]
MEHIVLTIVPRHAAERVRQSALPDRSGPHPVDGELLDDIISYAGRRDELVLLDPALDEPNFELAGITPHADVIFVEPDAEGGLVNKIIDDYPDLSAVHLMAAAARGAERRFLSHDGQSFTRDPDLLIARLVATVQRRLMTRGSVLIERRATRRMAWLVAPIDAA